MDEGRIVTNSEPSSDNENGRQNRYKKRLSTENISALSINDKVKATNLFRKKDSPQEAAAKGKRKSIKINKSASISASSSAASSNDSRVVNKKEKNISSKDDKKS